MKPGETQLRKAIRAQARAAGLGPAFVEVAVAAAEQAALEAVGATVRVAAEVIANNVTGVRNG